MIDPFKPLDSEPVSIMIGAYSAWTTADSYDPLVYAMKYVFLQDDTRVELAGENVAGVWTFVANSAFTSTLSIGRHNLDLIVERLSDNETVVLRTSTINCFATQTDRTSHAQVMVDKIESILTGRADSDVVSYTIKSRSIAKMSVKELTEWREYYLAELGRLPNELTGKRSTVNTLKVGFI